MKTKVLIFLASLLAFFMTSHATENKSLKVLVVYFSLTGNTRPVAEKIQQLTGADLFLIETVRTYPLERPAKAEEPKKELESGIWPELKAPPPDMSSYDLILVGGPVWWYTVSTPVRSFLQQADFAGKKVAPFVTHDGDTRSCFCMEPGSFQKPGRARRTDVKASRISSCAGVTGSISLISPEEAVQGVVP